MFVEAENLNQKIQGGIETILWKELQTWFLLVKFRLVDQIQQDQWKH